jgi:hypothetical protein
MTKMPVKTREIYGTAEQFETSGVDVVRESKPSKTARNAPGDIKRVGGIVRRGAGRAGGRIKGFVGSQYDAWKAKKKAPRKQDQPSMFDFGFGTSANPRGNTKASAGFDFLGSDGGRRQKPPGMEDFLGTGSSGASSKRGRRQKEMRWF